MKKDIFQKYGEELYELYILLLKAKVKKELKIKK